MSDIPMPGRFGCPHCSDRFLSVGEKKDHLDWKHPVIQSKRVKPVKHAGRHSKNRGRS